MIVFLLDGATCWWLLTRGLRLVALLAVLIGVTLQTVQCGVVLHRSLHPRADARPKG